MLYPAQYNQLSSPHNHIVLLNVCNVVIMRDVITHTDSSIPVISNIKISDDCYKKFTITWNNSVKTPLFNVILFQSDAIVDNVHTMNKYYMSSNLTPGNEYTITVISCSTSIDCNASTMSSLNFTVPIPGSKL